MRSRYLKAQAFLRRHGLFPCHRIIAVDLAQRLQHEPTWFRKTHGYLHKVSPVVRITVFHQRLDEFGHIPRMGVTHLNGGR